MVQYVFMVNPKLIKIKHHLQNPVLWLIVAVGAFIVFFGLTVWFRHQNLYTAQFDLGNMVQVMWHSLHGRWFQMTDPGSAMLVNRAGIHADFLLLIYLPFYAIWQSPLTLMFGQVLAVASGAIPLFFLARKRISPIFGLTVALLYLLYPPMHWAMLFDVHAVVLVTPLVLWMWWAIDARKWWAAGIFVALALLGKEEVGLVIALTSLYWLRNKETRKFAIGMFIAGISWSALMVGWVIPHVRNSPGHFALGYYSAYGDSSGEILRTIFFKPWIIIHDMLRTGSLHYYFTLLFPVGGLAVLGLPIFLMATPELAINVLSNNGNLRTIFFQYTSAITPYVFLATVIGTAFWYRWLQRRLSPQKFRLAVKLLYALMIASSAISVWRWAPIPGTKHNHEVIGVYRKSPNRPGIDIIQKLMLPNEKVAATNNVAAQFSNRDLIWGFPQRLDLAEGAVILRGSNYEQAPREEVSAKVEELLNDPNWKLLYRRSQLFYFRRVTK